MMGCWPHIAWRFRQGRLAVTRDHPRYVEIKELLPDLQTCHTVGMWDVLVQLVGRIWGDRDAALNQLWTSIMVTPYNQWHLGVTDVPGATPSNQPQESWHNVGVMMRIKNALNASTAHVLEKTLPKIINLDGASLPAR